MNGTPDLRRVHAAPRRVSGHTVIDVVGDRLGLVLAPQLGGRILSLCLDGQEFLHRSDTLLDAECGAVDPATVGPHGGEMADWRNWGGDKTWPAPQGWSGPDEWAGPPDPVLDSGPYVPRIEHGPDGRQVCVALTSAPDPRTGLQLRREIQLGAGGTDFALRLIGTNVSERPVRWALWNVTQLPGHPPRQEGDGVWIGLAPDGPTATPLVAGTGNPRVERHGPRLAHVPAQDVVGKAGFPAASGWIAHVGPAGTWAHRFPVHAAAGYPDEGARAEVWLEHPLDEPLRHLGGLQPTNRIVECEVLGPYVELAPGESMRLDTSVLLGPHGGAVTEVGPWGWWNLPLGLRKDTDGGIRLSGRLVPCADSDTPLTLGVTPRGARAATLHRTDLLVRAGQPLDLDGLPPLALVESGAVVEVFLGEGDGENCAGSAVCP
ncbi:DUF4380 domain-containing protein [Streptomyces endophyticus]|uniref:DUF4380 domain-containing protein n=1 Tax=Streptomyces endophyticus TaxID=714166 RepID=A0ABU6EYU1_9ACTN|nr:DUF4380 domain-containing protein [Streptomyces endophyticus]MEB8336925.1 DUF4380 domain-containing protein [Streptomyces endophyticus]